MSHPEREESERQLSLALGRLLRQTPIDKISVLDIIAEAEVSRATFYRYYYDKYRLMNATYDRVLAQTLYRFPKELGWKESLRSIYRVIQEDLSYYRNALSSTDVNGLKNHIYRISAAFHLGVLKSGGVDIDDWKVERVIQSHIYGNLEIMCSWIGTGMNESIDDMIDVMDETIPVRYAHHFLGARAT